VIGSPDNFGSESNPASDAIEPLLTLIGLAHWTPVLAVWVAQYDGLEKWLSEGDDAPAIALKQLLQAYLDAGVPVSDRQFVTDLLKLPFLNWHAKWPALPVGRGQWNPLVEPLAQFEQRCGGGEWPHIWESDRPAVNLDEIRRHLFAQLRAQRGSGGSAFPS